MNMHKIGHIHVHNESMHLLHCVAWLPFTLVIDLLKAHLHGSRSARAPGAYGM